VFTVYSLLFGIVIMAHDKTVDVNELLRLMIEQNRMREQQVEKLVTKLSERSNDANISSTCFIPNLNQTISTFDGATGDTAIAAEWLKALETSMCLNKWPSQYTLEAARSHLAGLAKQWYLGHMDELTNWSEFIVIFKKTFMRSATTAETWKKLQERIQGVNETTYSYFHEKIRLCRELKLDETETKQQICVGLRSQTLCMALMSSAHIREEELLAEIRRMEEVQLDRQLHFKNNSTITKKTAPTTSNVTQVAAIKEGTQKITNDWTREVRCYNFQQTSHISRDCDAPRKPLKCVICHQEGHTKKYCKTVTQPVVSLVNTKLNKSSYIKMVKINNNPVLIQGLVDTGCDVCLIKASAAKQLNLCVLPTTKQLTVYGNNPINVVNGRPEAEP